jgi:C-terminal processing protease CtpA/Prc
MIGMEIFRRFNIVFDYPHHRLFLKPGRDFNDAFEYNMSGMVLGRSRDNYKEIKKIYPGSAADSAGLKPGDRVTRINGVPSVQYDIWDLIPLMRREGKRIDLNVSRGDTEFEVSLILRRLI